MANVFDKIVGAKHVVAESSLLKATGAGHILSMKCQKDLDNGSIVTRGDWIEAQLYKTADYAAGKKPYLVLTPPLGYNGDRRSYQDECYFYNAKNEVARAYELYDGDVFTVSEEMFVGDPAVGKFIDGTYTVAEVAGDAGFVGEIVEKVNYTNSVSYRVFVRSIGV